MARLSSPLEAAFIIVAPATVIWPKPFHQDGVTLPDGRPPWETSGGQGAPMNSTPNPEQSNPNDVAVAALKQACQQIGRPDRQLRSVNEQVSRLKPDSGRHPSELQKRVPPHRSSLGRLALQGLIGLLVAACIGAAAMVLRSHGDAAEQVTARWEPQLYLISSPTAASPV